MVMLFTFGAGDQIKILFLRYKISVIHVKRGIVLMISDNSHKQNVCIGISKIKIAKMIKIKLHFIKQLCPMLE